MAKRNCVSAPVRLRLTCSPRGEGRLRGAKAMLDRLGKLTPELQRAIDKLRDIPTDIDPVFVTAGRISR